MGTFNMGDFDYDSGGGFGPYEATITNAGAAQGKYGAQMIFVCKPTNPQRRTQTLFLGMGKGEYAFGGLSEVIVTGEGEKAFENIIHKEIVSGPKINVMSNAGLFLNALKHLGFELAGADVSICVGLILDLEELDSNEVIRRFNETHPKNPLDARTGDYAKGKITIPTKIISMPIKKVSLKEAVLEVIEDKTEAEMVKWYKTTDYYNGVAVTPLHIVLDELEKTEVSIVNDKYLVKKDSVKEKE